MNDPSQSLAPELISTDFIAERLRPQILETDLVAWQALPSPAPESTFVTWQTPHLRDQFPSDGYIWADAEQRYTQQLAGGYSLDIFAHRAGYAPANPQPDYCTITRRRYRLRLTNPAAAPAGPPPCDPNLWLTMYGLAAPRDQIPVDRVHPDPVQDAAWKQRMALLRNGRLQVARRSFRFHDRATYPVLSAAAPDTTLALRPGYRTHAANMGRAAGGAQAAKRARTNTRGDARPGAPVDGYPGEDQVDVLTPRDVSHQRFMQHHEWMEEVLASPYDTAKIRPVALGLGRTGALEPLTRGLFRAPDPQPQTLHKETTRKGANQIETVGWSYGVETATPLAPPVVAEFTARVSARLEAMEEELAELERQHADRMAALSLSARFREMEKRLRTASFEVGPTSADVPAAESVDDIVRSMEESAGSRIVPLPAVRRVRDGGLEDDKAASPAPAAPDEDVSMGGTGAEDAASTGQQASAGANSTGAATPSLNPTGNATPTTVAPAAASKAPADAPKEPSAAPSAGKVASPAAEQAGGDEEDWVILPKEDSAPGSTVPVSVPTTDAAGAAADAVTTPAEDIGADLIDFGDGSDVAMEGDEFTGGAFEEAMGLTSTEGEANVPAAAAGGFSTGDATPGQNTTSG